MRISVLSSDVCCSYLGHLRCEERSGRFAFLSGGLNMDFTTDVPSTVIDTDTGPSASGGSIPNLTEPVDTKPASLRDDLESVFKEDADKQKVEEQPKDE